MRPLIPELCALDGAVGWSPRNAAASRIVADVRFISIHDTRTGSALPLQTGVEGRVGIYACGPTVYSRVHVGNARPFVVFSILKRFLEREGYHVTLVVNVTDVNDKIYDAARVAGRSSDELAREMTAHYIADTDRLGLGRPDFEPRATETIQPIIGLIDDLVSRGHAYAEQGDVYFRVRSLPSYGDLSHRDVDQMDQGEGVEGAALKEDPLDFALWKAAKPGEDVFWDSPWGTGRPGWHIECSAMAEELLGVGFEIHGGGIDLAFPHHENEAAQTLAARGEQLARIWMHNGMVELGGHEKMSKSLGNIRGLADVIDEFGRDAVLYWLLSGHYRQPLAFAAETLEAAAASLQRIVEAGRRLGGAEPNAECSDSHDAFFAALADDFNTPRALAALFGWINAANRCDPAPARGQLEGMLGILGLANLLEGEEQAPAEVVALAQRRDEARAAKDWATADALRDELAALGWEVRDGTSGPELIKTF